MTGFEGVLFDGVRAVGLPVRIEAHGDLMLIATPVEAEAPAGDGARAKKPGGLGTAPSVYGINRAAREWCAVLGGRGR